MIELEIKKQDGLKNLMQKAKQVAIQQNDVVFFVLQDVRVEVDKETNIDWLLRDFFNALNMEWEKVGPECVERYDEATQKLIDEKNNELNL